MSQIGQLILGACALTLCYASNVCAQVSTQINSLSDLSVNTLRERTYSSTLVIEKKLQSKEYDEAFSKDGTKPYDTYIASYMSDGLRLYTRVDIPSTPMPKGGYPVIIYAHGYAGIKAAPNYHFSFDPKAYYGSYIDALVDKGFVVIAPGYRGHGTIGGIAADGIEFMRDWDNGSYVSTSFYAVDILNLLEGIQTLEEALPTKIDMKSINLTSHSQGGDVGLISLAVAADNTNIKNHFNAGSLWAGTFVSRFAQADTYHAMAVTPQAFMSGDGTWTGTAIGKDGSVNYDFVFGYPRPYIEIMDSTKWTWQNDSWRVKTVAQARAYKYQQMYDAVNKGVANINDAKFEMIVEEGKATRVRHDLRVEEAMKNMGAYHRADLISTRVNLHYSDQDLSSLPTWNEDLCRRLNAEGGACAHYLYPHNNHSLRLSNYDWYSPKGSAEGFGQMIERDVKMFLENNK